MKKTIKTVNLMSLIVLISCCDIAYINYLSNKVSPVLLMARLIFIAILIIKKIMQKEKNKSSKIFKTINLLFILICINSLLRTTDIFFYLIKIMSKPYLIILFIDSNFNNEDKINSVLDIWKKYLLLICIIDLITIIIFPNGMYKDNNYSINWFLGYKTARMVYSWALLFIHSYIEYKRPKNNNEKLSKSTMVIYIICIYSAFKSHASAASTALLLYGILVYITNLGNKHTNKLYKFLSPKKLLIYCGIIYYLVMSIESNPYIQNFVISVFNKSTTLSNRTGIWENCFSFYMQSPIFGKGIFTTTEYIEISKYFLGTNAHNLLLTLLISGGAIGLSLYIYMFKVCMCRKIKKYTKRELSLVYAIAIFLFVGLTSSALAFSPFAFLPFILLEYEKRKDENNEKNNNKQ